MSTKLSAESRASIRSALSTALDAARPAARTNPIPMPQPSRRSESPIKSITSRGAAKVSAGDLRDCVRSAISSTELTSDRDQRQAPSLSPLEASRLRTEHIADRLGLFLASLSGALQLYAPLAADEIYAFLMKTHGDAVPACAPLDQTATEKDVPPCQQ